MLSRYNKIRLIKNIFKIRKERPHSVKFSLEWERLETYIVSDCMLLNLNSARFCTSSSKCPMKSARCQHSPQSPELAAGRVTLSPQRSFFTLQQYLLFGHNPLRDDVTIMKLRPLKHECPTAANAGTKAAEAQVQDSCLTLFLLQGII